MSKEILLVVDAVSNEKGVSQSVIFDAIEAALASATKKRNKEDIDVRVAIDRSTGEYETFRRWQVVDDEYGNDSGDEDEEQVFNPDHHIHLTEALKQNSEYQIDDYIEEPMESVEFGRIAAQAAKQVIVQKVREAERSQVVELFKSRVGELVNGVVKRTDRGNVILDLGGNAEAVITRDQLVPKEAIRPGDRVRGFLYEIKEEVRGPQLFVSRVKSEFLIELFKLEVPEISQGLLDVMGAARDAGQRAKISVHARDKRTDAIGACVGMRGSRVQAVSNELAGERVDIILWDENPAQYVINAMAPAEVLSIVVDEENKSMNIAVEEEELSQAIGRGGQNVRLASELTGWELNVMTDDQAKELNENEVESTAEMFMQQLDVDKDIAVILVQEGFTSVEEVAYVPESELVEIAEFDKDIVEELRSRAKDYLLTQLIAEEEKLDDAKPSKELLKLEGMDKKLAYKLSAKGVCTVEQLAELATDELVDLSGINQEKAGALIMKAREPWFAK